MREAQSLVYEIDGVAVQAHSQQPDQAQSVKRENQLRVRDLKTPRARGRKGRARIVLRLYSQ